MNDAGVAPPGVMPIQQPTRHARSDVTQYFGSVAQVFSTMFGSILPLLPLNDEALLHREQDLAQAEQADHRDQEVEALQERRAWPKVMRSVPVTVSMPTAASAKPSIIDAMVFTGGSRPMPTKLQKREELDREVLGRAELERELARPAARGT